MSLEHVAVRGTAVLRRICFISKTGGYKYPHDSFPAATESSGLHQVIMCYKGSQNRSAEVHRGKNVFHRKGNKKTCWSPNRDRQCLVLSELRLGSTLLSFFLLKFQQVSRCVSLNSQVVESAPYCC